MNNNMNHTEFLPTVQAADQLVDTVLKHLGDTWSSAGILHSAVEMIHDNEDYDLRIIIARGGFTVEWDGDREAWQVLDDFARAFEILEETIYEED